MTEPTVPQVKRCPCCKESKPIAEYHRNKARKDGLASVCKPCKQVYGRLFWSKTGPEAKAQRKRYKENQKQKRQESLVDLAHYKTKNRQYNLKRDYGLTPHGYDEMFRLQGGCCAICKQPQRKRLTVDHSHYNGRVRALLCALCNAGIGHFREDVERLRSAIEYIQFHSAV